MWHQVIGVGTSGGIEIQFQYMKLEPPFDKDSQRLDLLRRLNDIQGIDILADKITTRPSLPLHILEDDTVMEHVLRTLVWLVQEITAS